MVTELKTKKKLIGIHESDLINYAMFQNVSHLKTFHLLSYFSCFYNQNTKALELKNPDLYLSIFLFRVLLFVDLLFNCAEFM